jgi:hypothetical protein
MGGKALAALNDFIRCGAQCAAATIMLREA